ncbi:hypothetical protein SSAG_02609 [Streptomyces sp. Mg1]|nr:hypothetical protein SSAG_02609 [Streptomyces sp. Mg1]
MGRTGPAAVAQTLVDMTDAYNDWAAIRRGDREPLAEEILEEAGRLLAGSWPPLG